MVLNLQLRIRVRLYTVCIWISLTGVAESLYAGILYVGRRLPTAPRRRYWGRSRQLTRPFLPLSRDLWAALEVPGISTSKGPHAQLLHGRLISFIPTINHVSNAPITVDSRLSASIVGLLLRPGRTHALPASCSVPSRLSRLLTLRFAVHMYLSSCQKAQSTLSTPHESR